MKLRIIQTNALRDLLHEFGEILPESYRAFSKAFPAALARAAERLPAMLIDSLREQWTRAQDTDREMVVLERRLASLFRNNPDCQKVADIPGVGLLTATATVAAIGDVRTFKFGREFAAWLGLVPQQSGTGGRVRQMGLSNLGDTYLRTLLLHGARSVIIQGKRSAWIDACSNVDHLALVQIGGPDEIFVIERIANQADRTAFQAAGAVVSLRPSFARLNWPLRMRCINSMPERVIAAFLNRLKPSIAFVRDLMFRWSCSSRWIGPSCHLAASPRLSARAQRGAMPRNHRA
ncbi:hypothetical protein QF025_002671 [Paraburkholderia graminis]|uniref:Transposase IS116/IS110/IS902 C-terminal domain-containing protein n=1 Tax=Paraburkholderia graminis TaxID=60548 RepID=A0ABD5CF72_9BURK|nr:hypothetical protein [Paraburkholderia graminis]